MTSDEASTLERECWDLASGFANGELDEAGQQRLYQLLRGNNQQARLAARTTWRALAMRTDLRCALDSETFTQATAMRIDAERQGNGFMQSVLDRLGFRSRRLSPVSPTNQQLLQRSWRPLLIGMAIMGLVITLLTITTMNRGSQLQVIASNGVVRHDGALLGQRQFLGPGVLTVTAGSQVQLAAEHGADLWIAGPAQASISSRGLGLASGRARVRSGSHDLAVGSPDGQLILHPESEAIIEIIDGQLSTGVMHGHARWLAANESELTLTAEQALFAQTVFPWLSSRLETSKQWRPAIPEHSTLWQADATWHPEHDGVLTVSSPQGEPLIRLSQGQLSRDDQRWQLPGPPRQERHLQFFRRGDRHFLRIQGSDQQWDLGQQPPRQWHASGSSRLGPGRWWSGPDRDFPSPE